MYRFLIPPISLLLASTASAQCISSTSYMAPCGYEPPIQYNTQSLGGGAYSTQDNYGNHYITTPLGRGASTTTDSFGNRCLTTQLGFGSSTTRCY